MRLDIDGSSLIRRPAVRRHIEGEIARCVAPFAHRIGTVRIRLRERAPSEATRVLCGIGVTLEPRGDAAAAWVLARADEDDACRAVSHAAERLARAVGDEIARRDREQAVRARALIAVSRAGIAERV
ncbi:MAG: hypothetical protein ACM3NQ_16830 [Bacteroidales bacterium]